MHLDTLKTQSEINECIDLYIVMNDETFTPSNEGLAISNLTNLISTPKSVFRTIKDDSDKIIGWVLGEVGDINYVKGHVLRQTFYASNQQGFKAARALILAHNFLIEHAEKRGYPYVMSTCSHMDEQQQLCKILAKRGWETRTYVAIWKTSHFNN